MEEGEKINERKKFCRCFRHKWTCILTMCGTLVIAAILVARLMLNILEINESSLLNQHLELDQLSYPFLSTKTDYPIAYHYLNGSPDTNAMYQYDTRDYKADPLEHRLPNIFSEKENLKSLNDKLIQDYGCQVRQLHFFGRHAARYPSEDDMNFTETHLKNVQKRIDLSKMESQANLIHDHRSSTQNSNLAKENSTSPTAANESDFLASYKHWTPFFKSDLANLIMVSGFKATEQISLRMKSVYPQMFDAQQSTIKIASTSKNRAAQTAITFAKHIDNLVLGGCDKSSVVYPPSSSDTSHVTSDHFVAHDIYLNQSSCLKSFIKSHLDKNLEFHTECDGLKQIDTVQDYKLNLSNLSKVWSIADSISRKLQLAHGQSLNYDETIALYKTCQFESAHNGGRSIWCLLFDKEDLKFLEFKEDVDDFFSQAYGDERLYRSACHLTTELMTTLRSGTGQTSRFSFTHSAAIMRLLAASVDMSKDSEYLVNNVRMNLASGRAPSNREWRTSILSPFSANLAFTLYACPNSEKLDEATESQQASDAKRQNIADRSGYIGYDLNQKIESKVVVATLNEKPITLDGCKKSICDLRDLLYDSRLNTEKRCVMKDICREKKIYI